MYSFLSEIENYINNNGLPFRTIYVKSSCFPEYFNLWIWNELHSIGGKECVDSEITEYGITYIDGYAYLEVESKTCDKKIVIFNKTCSDYGIDWYSIKESRVIEGTDWLIRKFRKHLSSLVDSKSLLADYNWDSRKIKFQLRDSAKKCIQYMDYLYKRYQVSLQELDEVNRIDVYYSEKECNSLEAIHSSCGCNSNGRINEIISLDDRVRVLRENECVFYGNAHLHGKEKIEYLCYLYRCFDGQYALVLEPFSGTKTTRVVMIDKNTVIDREEFSLLVRQYLELSDYQINLMTNILRMHHTSTDTFHNNINLIVNGKTRGRKYGFKALSKLNNIKASISEESE